MANLIQATVYQIDGAPLSSPINIDFQTSNIVIREASINIAAVNSAIQYYNVPNNALSVKTYYVSETIANLVSDANVGTVTQVQATVIEVNKDPQLDSIQYSFPANEILVGEVIGSTTGINSTITFKNDVYSVAETQATLLAAVNDLSDFVLNKGGVPSFQANTLANLPMPGSAGRMFVSTDTYAFYRDNGIGWDLMGGPGIGTVTGSGVATQVAFWNGTSVISGSSNLFWDGVNARLGIGTASPAQQLDVAGSARIQTIANATTDTDRFLVSDSGVIKYRTGAEVLSDIGAPAGTGTTNYLVKWTGTTALGNSLVFDNGTSVGINTASPSATYKLDVSGNAQIINPLATTTLRLGNGAIYTGTLDFGNSYISQTSGPLLTIQSNATLDLSTNFATRLRVTMAGRVLIGTTTESTYELDVVGDIRSTLDANINGLTVGLGGGSVANNTSLGYQAINNGSTTGQYNTAIGFIALKNLTTGNYNTAIGAQALQQINSAASCVSIGTSSSYSLTSGSFTTAVGTNALERVTTAQYNTGIGALSLNFATGASNVALGYYSGYSITTGTYNTIIGTGTVGNGITTGSFNTIIGSQITGLSSSLSNTIILADGQGNQRLYIDNLGEVGIGTTNPTNMLIVRKDQNAITSIEVSNETSGVSASARLVATTGASKTTTIGKFATTASAYKIISADDGFIQNQTGSLAILADGGSTNIKFAAGGSSTSQMTLFSNGNLGVGTGLTDAGYKLDVNGTARVQGSSGELLLLGSTTPSGITNPVVLNLGGTYGSSAVGSRNNLKLKIYENGSSLNDTYGIGLSAGVFEIQSAGNIGFFTGASATRTERMRISDANGNVGIGTTSPNASALLDVSSTTKGFLPPRGTNAQMVAIATPATGLMFFDTTNNKLNVYDGTNWVAVH